MRFHMGKYFTISTTTASLLLLAVINAYFVSLPMLQLVSLSLVMMLVARRLSENVAGQSGKAAVPDGIRNAIEFAHDGILILDADCRITYANPEFRRVIRLSEERLAQYPAFAEIIQQGRTGGLFDLDATDGEFNLEMRMAAIREGDHTPITLRMADHSTMRLSINLLPDGSWMLICSNITDLAHDAERLEVLAHIDSMTGLINRRRFFDLAGREWMVSHRYGRDLAVVMLDLDHFKLVNDTFGHSVGDDAIRHVAAICQDSKRATDVVARLGGEEFALLLPETDEAGALIVAERIRSRVFANPLPTESGPVHLSVSIGIAQRSKQIADFDSLLKLSDQRLYAAKRAGRNCVVTHDGEPGQTMPTTAAA